MYNSTQLKSLQDGVVPVMLTPFTDDLQIDYPSLERLIEWYIYNGAKGLFAACQSSEIMHLSDSEMQQLVAFIVEKTAGRVPVIASGHTADSLEDQIQQLQGMVDAGVDGLVLITNRLGPQSASDNDVIEYMEKLLVALPSSIPMGLYECPSPWKRLLSNDLLQWCVDSGRFTFLKDTCCSTEILAQRLNITRHTPFKIYNANGPTLLESLKMGAAGYSGVMANYHCELYAWLCQHYQEESALVTEVGDFLSITSLSETVAYPVSAKYAQKQLGVFNTTRSRTLDDNIFYHSANIAVIEHLQRLAQTYHNKIEQN
ncbi:dihydrodipicolinate synthase family protein [Vibrio sinensis]|uniref:Dihydrodipicolinate synthase family protein n=1 Tax=Vibrio sinensis TaxID=2302434 RepID=A0A3A6R3B1_9VIBR|nr:dihydrodipicolinate synthase family protein [Vibrio sinensis]RJX75627.1 dihydrodipicolinate synthase family protein [Vibrio sinensis]